MTEPIQPEEARRLCDIIEADGGYRMVNYDMVVDGERYDDREQAPILRELLHRARDRETDPRAAQRQGYEMAVRDLREATKGLTFRGGRGT